MQRPPRAVRPGRTEVARAAGARVASVRRAARPRIALVPMLHRRGGDEAFAVVDDGFLLSTLPDGWRCLALLDDRVRLRSRAGRDLAPSLPGIATALAKLCPPRGAGPTILDGIVILPSAGERPSPTLADVLAFAVLDVLCVAGRDVTGRALRERQELLRGLSWSRDGAVRFEPLVDLVVEERPQRPVGDDTRDGEAERGQDDEAECEADAQRQRATRDRGAGSCSRLRGWCE